MPTRSYERGDAGLKKELSENLDLTYRFNHDWVSAEFNLFHNWVSNYIFPATLRHRVIQ